MRNDLYKRFAISTALCALMASGTAAAQEADTAAPANDTEIVVTAQKRSERLLDVPVAISAVSSETLTTQAFNRISDYFDRVPGLQYSGQRVSSLSLRGVTTGGANSPTLAILVDDVQFGGTTGGGQPPIPDFDASAVSRIEVLRGPQGTLYGASSLGGLIKYVLKEPDTRDFSGRIELAGTSIDGGSEGWAARGSINIPITDRLAVLGSGFYRDDARFLDNINPAALKSKNVNEREAWGFRGAVLFEPTDNLKFLFSALNQTVDAINSDLAVTSGGVRLTSSTNFTPLFGDLTLNSLDSYNHSKFQLYSARGEWDMGGATLTSVSAWSRADNVISSDVTGVFLNLFRLPFSYGPTVAPADATVVIDNADYTHKFSQELRFAGEGDTFDWLIGGFYTIEHVGTDQTLRLNSASGSQIAVPYAGLGPSSYREKSIFADLTYHVTDKFDIQVGGRYASNKQKSSLVFNNDAPAIPLFGPNGIQSQDSKDNAFTWLISPSYKIGPDMMIYARAATGYRPGGPNIEQTGPQSFGPDRVTNYELGFKGRVVPGVLTIDTSIFQIDWKNIQLQGTAPSQLTFRTNGGKARSRGIEFSATVTPWEGMTIAGNMAITDAELTEALPAIENGLRAADGAALPYTSKFNANLSVDQTFELASNLEGSVGASFTRVGDRPGAFLSVNGTGPRLELPGYSVFDLRAGLTLDEVWSATAFIRNLGDRRGITLADDRNGTNITTALYIQPRTFGLTLARSF